MAVTNSLDSNLTAISSITRKYFIPKLADNINDSNVALMKIRKESVDGGDDIRQPVRYARGTQENYSGTSLLDTSYIEKKTALIFNWKQKNFPIVISGLDELKNAGNAKVIDHVRSEVQAAQEDAEDSFATGLYSAGTDALEIDGARVWLSTSNTYGGIDQSSYSWLQAQIDSTTTTISLAKMQERYEACKQKGKGAPDLITTTETEFNKVWGLIQPQQRFSDGDTAKAGFKNLMFNGAIFSEDSYCPSGHMVFWTLANVCLKSHGKRKFPGMFIDFERPYNQDVRVAHIRWAGNLVCDQPRKQGAFTALA
jgi:hypothetical protein